MSKTVYNNKWKEYHDFLEDKKAAAFKEDICKILGCHPTTFFRKLANPGQMSIAEKKAVAEVYQLPATFLFPELEPQPL